MPPWNENEKNVTSLSGLLKSADIPQLYSKGNKSY